MEEARKALLRLKGFNVVGSMENHLQILQRFKPSGAGLDELLIHRDDRIFVAGHKGWLAVRFAVY